MCADLSSLTDLAVQGLATRRLTALVTSDQIMQPVRSRFVNRSLREEAKPLDESLGYLVTCDSCVSVWAGAAVVLAYRSSRWGKAAVTALALSQVSKMVVYAGLDD